MPKRIQRKRTKGYRLPPNAVYVGRPSRWGNPFSGPEAVGSFRAMLMKSGAWIPVPLPWPHGKVSAYEPTTVQDVRIELRGKNLVCWCPLDQPCHADALLEWANEAAP